jgi:cell division transport system permease protein
MKNHIKTSLKYIRRSPFQAIAAIFSLGLTFFVATFLAVLTYASNQALIYFETRPQIIVFLKNDADSDKISNLQNKLGSDSRTKDVKFVSKEKALEIYKGATSDNPLLTELVSPSTLPASIEFSLKDLSEADKIIQEVKNEDIVDSIGFTASIGSQSNLPDVITRLKNISRYIKLGGIIFTGVLGLTSFMVLIIIISMRISARKPEVETLSLIGARPGFIRFPILLEAVSYGIIGSILGWIVAIIVILYLTPSTLSFFGVIPVLPRNPEAFFGLLGIILAGELAVALLVTTIAGMAATSKALAAKK